jgi:hypothetical protein
MRLADLKQQLTEECNRDPAAPQKFLAFEAEVLDITPTVPYVRISYPQPDRKVASEEGA